MILADNLSETIPKEQNFLKEHLENFVKELSTFFEQEQIESIARETEFVERESKLTGMLFLSIFVFGASMYGNPTLEQFIGLLHMYMDDLTISRPGLHKRITDKAVKFFARILSLAMQLNIPENPRLELPQFPNIRIWDSTSFQLPPGLAPYFEGKGGSGSPAGAKIHFGYDFMQHQWCYALVSATESDLAIGQEIVARTQPGDLTLMDLGYFNVELFAEINDKGGYYLSRLKHDVNVHELDEHGQLYATDLHSLLMQHQELFEARLELKVFIRSKHDAYTPVTLVIERLPQQVADQRRQKLNKEARSRGRQVTLRTSFLAGFNFYVSNAPEELLPSSCYRFLYAIRWQIELVFKAWKSHLEIHKVQVKHRPERVRATIFAKLIFITLTAKAFGLARDELWLTSQLEVSYYRALRHFQSIAELWFSMVIRAEYHEIYKLLQHAISFIQRRSFKIPQWDRLYPLERLQLFGNLVVRG